VLAVVTLITGVFFAGGSVLAVHDAGLFELDVDAGPPVVGNANVADDAGVAGEDWETIYASIDGDNDPLTNPTNAFGVSFISDPVGSAENSYYTGGGSKDISDISGKNSWQYGTGNDPIPDKDDITNAFAAAYTDPFDDHTIIYFGMDRYDNNGDAEAGFWFFKDIVTLGTEPNFNGVHEVGDVLVLINWGGSNPVGEMTVYQWVGGKNPLALVADNLTADCATAGTDDNFCGVANRDVVDPPWDFLDKGGSTDIRPLELLEAGLDINALFGEDICFSSFLASTRSSHSTTAQLKDFALGGFEQCGAELATQVSDTSILPGETVYDSATITVTGGTSPAPTGFVQFSLDGVDFGAPVDLATAVQVGDTYTVQSETVSPTTPGNYCFSATWPGDSNYTDGPYTDDGTNECFDVEVFQPELSTTQTVTIKDEATISVSGGGDLDGQAHFQPFSDSSCTAGNELAAVQDIDVAGASSQTVGTTPMTIVDPGEPTIYWQVSYTSDNPAQADIAATCTENSSIVIND
jgi:hypothetical protein